uniref:hypothetical protein n=1 Tax=Marinobacterium profundum TaxID=1714300 RepID=UPI00082F1D88|nr:hypothetical protein [Marinobacterium profundum]
MTNTSNLKFHNHCGDCGRREVVLPDTLPHLGDDFDWLQRDYDGFRLAMLEELAARFPERKRWTPADMEVVLVEAFSVLLDQYSDSLDRSQAEAYLETARRPNSVRKLLSMIGYDAIAQAPTQAAIPEDVPGFNETLESRLQRLVAFLPAFRALRPQLEEALQSRPPSDQQRVLAFLSDAAAADNNVLNSVQGFLDAAPDFVRHCRRYTLDRFWTLYPNAMDQARRDGPRQLHRQSRMVTLADYANLAEHPLVLRAQASSRWAGSWQSIDVAVTLLEDIPLDLDALAAELGAAFPKFQYEVEAFHRANKLVPPQWAPDISARTLLRPLLDHWRMAGQEVFLRDAERIGIDISLAVRAASNYYQSEIRHAVEDNIRDFFAPGRLQFGEDIHASDIVERIMALDGIDAICLNRFKRVGKRWPDQSGAGLIRLEGIEIAICDSLPGAPERGSLRIKVQGGQRG